MTFLLNLLLFLHIVGVAVIVGTWIYTMKRPTVTAGQFWAAVLMLITGLGLVGIHEMDGGSINYAKITVKIVILLVVLVAAQIGCALSLDTVRDNVSSDGVVFRPLAQPQRPLDVQLVWRAADPNPALRAVVRLAQNLYGDPRGQAAEVPGS